MILQFTDFAHLQNWSVQYLLGSVVRYNKSYDTVPIGTLIKRSITPVTIEDDVEYIRPTVRTMGGGVVRRDVAKGVDIGTKKQYRLRQGQFLLSKIDARNGAFGIVPKECDGAIITSNFWTYYINESLVIPQYLALVASTRLFADFAEKASNGTTNRHYLQEDLLLRKQVPLPTIAEQNALVDKYNALIEETARKEQHAMQIEREIQTYLSTELGITSTQQEKRKGLYFVKFSDMVDRWDVYSSNAESVFDLLRKSRYSCSKLKDAYTFASRRWNRPNTSEVKEMEYIELGSINEQSEIVEVSRFSTNKIPSRATQEVKAGDLLIGTTRPYLKKFAIVDGKHDGYVCSSGFQIVDSQSRNSLEFLLEYLKSDVAVRLFEYYMTGALYPAITSADLQQLPIPLPPLEKQTEIAGHIATLRAEIKQLKSEASAHRQKAIADFEQAIFEK